MSQDINVIRWSPHNSGGNWGSRSTFHAKIDTRSVWSPVHTGVIFTYATQKVRFKNAGEKLKVINDLPPTRGTKGRAFWAFEPSIVTNTKATITLKAQRESADFQLCEGAMVDKSVCFNHPQAQRKKRFLESSVIDNDGPWFALGTQSSRQDLTSSVTWPPPYRILCWRGTDVTTYKEYYKSGIR